MASFDFHETRLSQKTLNTTDITELSPTLKLAGPFGFLFFFGTVGVFVRFMFESSWNLHLHTYVPYVVY